MQDFTSNLVTVQQLFQTSDEFFRVPKFQRPFCWSEDFEDFINDIRNAQDADETSAYFIGGVVLASAPEDANLYYVIDGQQRLMTITIIIAAAIDYFREIGDQAKVNFYGKYLSHQEMGADNSVVDHWKLTPSDRDRDFFFETVYHQPVLPSGKLAKSHRLIAEARDYVLSLFKETLTEAETNRLLQYLLKRVKLVKTVAANMRTAFQIFQTLNDRGVSLGPEDLLKSLILSRVPEDKTDDVADRWEKMREMLAGANLKFPRFLRHYVMSLGNEISSERLFEWFEERVSDGLWWFKVLFEAAETYCGILKTPLNESIDALQTLRFVQAYVPLLAATGLRKEHYAQLSELLEKLAVRYAVTRHKTNELEGFICTTAANLRKATSPGAYDEAKVGQVLEELRVRVRAKDAAFETSFEALTFGQTQEKKRVKYLLSRLSSALDSGDCTKLEVEHVWPQTAKAEDIARFGADVYDQFVGRLGNMTLLTREENASIGNKSYAEKIMVYNASTVRLSQTLARVVSTGTINTKHDKALAALDYVPTNEWGPAAIESRQKAYARLAMHIWGV